MGYVWVNSFLALRCFLIPFGISSQMFWYSVITDDCLLFVACLRSGGVCFVWYCVEWMSSDIRE
ncbi:hypothetical protein QBC41DRAFT_328515 [Cercophora samala]|uniref:Uncharacterized protein n=1 Tax=Cercophora samala TaxID=330535 RepID=A0AA40D663_9PEZI|nr:hypothetical protein QBC41DRAFT_328515 [Cercophora samala]